MSRATRWTATGLGALLLAQGLGKALAFDGYLSAMGASHVIPSALIPTLGGMWVAGEILSGAILLVTGLSQGQWRGLSARLSLAGAALALVVNLAYLALTLTTYGRGGAVQNCTCFGIFMAQPLGISVLIQDFFMVGYAVWLLRSLSTSAAAPPAGPLERTPEPPS